MIAPAGSPIEIATGIIIAIIDIGPKPGNIPMNVPMRHPATTIRIIFRESAVDRPINRPSII
jgi:hypothetical protein